MWWNLLGSFKIELKAHSWEYVLLIQLLKDELSHKDPSSAWFLQG